LTANPIIP